jgi:hypothetical protein
MDNEPTQNRKTGKTRRRETKESRCNRIPLQCISVSEKRKAHAGYQMKHWWEMVRCLQEFKKENSHCQIPSNYEENPALVDWVNGSVDILKMEPWIENASSSLQKSALCGLPLKIQNDKSL